MDRTNQNEASIDYNESHQKPPSETPADRRRMDWIAAGVFAMEDSLTQGFVYFAESGPFVKIGYSWRARERVRKMHTSNPYEVKLIGLLKGGKIREAELHKMFADARYRNEWFHLTDDVRRRIIALVGEWDHLDRPTKDTPKSLRSRYLRHW